jgi:predicted GNAT family acetyltransferase
VKFIKYDDIGSFGSDTLEILSENEVQNNLPISFIFNERGNDTSNWLLTSIKDETGSVILTAACTPPFNIVMYETRNKPNDEALKLLSAELKSMGFVPPGVLAEQGLARRFAEIFTTNSGYHRHMSMNIMRLDKVHRIQEAPGHCRLLRKDDLYFAPYWERSFGEDCQIEIYDIPTYVKQITARIDLSKQYIWIDGHPVSQTYNARNTQNGAGISGVYTPPQYRGKGYASSVVAKLSQILLDCGSKFCFLFADAENPISCGIYRKLGFYDLCVFDELKFSEQNLPRAQNLES